MFSLALVPDADHLCSCVGVAALSTSRICVDFEAPNAESPLVRALKTSQEPIAIAETRHPASISAQGAARGPLFLRILIQSKQGTLGGGKKDRSAAGCDFFAAFDIVSAGGGVGLRPKASTGDERGPPRNLLARAAAAWRVCARPAPSLFTAHRLCQLDGTPRRGLDEKKDEERSLIARAPERATSKSEREERER